MKNLKKKKKKPEPETDDLGIVSKSPLEADSFWWQRARCFSHLIGQPDRGQTVSAASQILPRPHSLSWSQTLLDLFLQNYTESQM